MSNQAQKAQAIKLLRAVACSGVILGPYLLTMAKPEETIKYRFNRLMNEKVNSTYNRFATEVAYRMRLPDQMRRTPNFDIRSAVHTGLDFDINGHFTPAFDGIAYLMVPQWANITTIDDLKKVKIDISGHVIDFSRIDFSKLNQKKLKRLFNIPEEPAKSIEQIPSTIKESKPWLGGWFSRSSSSSSSLPSTTEVPLPVSSPSAPLTRELLLIDRLIDTFFLSDEAKKYIITDQFQIASGPWHVIPWFVVASSFFLPFTLYTRLRHQFQTRFKRFIFFHFLLFNGLLCFYLSPFLGRLINMQVSRIRDSTSIEYGLDILEGGIEYLEKQIERHRILRELMPNGKDFFDADGERTKLPVYLSNLGLTIPMYQWNPLLNYRLKKLKAKLNKFASITDEQARKTIFKST